MNGLGRFWALGLLASLAVPAEAQNTQRGAALGGVTGAIAGGLIGDNNGEAGAGALIGAGIGAVTGAVLGNARDQEEAYTRYQAQQQATYAIQHAVTQADVIAMARSGLSESVIVNHIRQRGVQRRPEVSDIIAMHQQGVSDHVIATMQSAQVGAPTTYVSQVQPAPVVIQRYHSVPTYIVPGPSYYHHHHARPYFHARYHW